MSLLDVSMETCIMLDKTSAPDGYGGTMTVWKDGAEFMAAVSLDTSMTARTAGVQGLTSLYTITTRRNVNLQFHDVFRRKRDGKIFRVTSDGDDKKTPAPAGLDMRVVTGEEWSLPMDKWQAQDTFWNSFGLPAYDENTMLDEEPAYPYLTYEAQDGAIDQTLSLSASLWYRSTSWREISLKADEIHAAVKHGVIIRVNGGFLWIKSPEGAPFAQRMTSGGDEDVKRMYITLSAEALTE